MYGKAGTPSHLERSRVMLSPDRADSTEVGTENIVSVARLLLREGADERHNIKYSCRKMDRILFEALIW